MEQSKSYGRTGRSWSISPAETCVALVVISSSAAQQAPCPVQWRCKTTKNKQKSCSFCATNLGALLFLCPSTWSVLRCSGERQTCLPWWGYSHLPQTPEGNTPWLPRKALWRFPPSAAADNRRKCAHVTHVHQPFPRCSHRRCVTVGGSPRSVAFTKPGSTFSFHFYK